MRAALLGKAKVFLPMRPHERDVLGRQNMLLAVHGNLRLSFIHHQLLVILLHARPTNAARLVDYIAKRHQWLAGRAGPQAIHVG